MVFLLGFFALHSAQMALSPCQKMFMTRIWVFQESCYLEGLNNLSSSITHPASGVQYRDNIVNILQLKFERFGDSCKFTGPSVADGGLLAEGLLYLNVTIDVPDDCEHVYVAPLDTVMGTVNDIELAGTITVKNMDLAQQYLYFGRVAFAYINDSSAVIYDNIVLQDENGVISTGSERVVIQDIIDNNKSNNIMIYPQGGVYNYTKTNSEYPVLLVGNAQYQSVTLCYDVDLGRKFPNEERSIVTHVLLYPERPIVQTYTEIAGASFFYIDSQDNEVYLESEAAGRVVFRDGLVIYQARDSSREIYCHSGYFDMQTKACVERCNRIEQLGICTRTCYLGWHEVNQKCQYRSRAENGTYLTEEGEVMLCDNQKVVYNIVDGSCTNQCGRDDIQYGHGCFTECPDGTVETNGVCERITSCPSGYWLVDPVSDALPVLCVTECPEPYHIQDTDNVCRIDCKETNKVYEYYTGQCTVMAGEQQCRDGYVLQEYAGARRCQYSCVGSYYNHSGVCVEDCPDFFIPVEEHHQCVPCNSDLLGGYYWVRETKACANSCEYYNGTQDGCERIGDEQHCRFFYQYFRISDYVERKICLNECDADQQFEQEDGSVICRQCPPGHVLFQDSYSFSCIPAGECSEDHYKILDASNNTVVCSVDDCITMALSCVDNPAYCPPIYSSYRVLRSRNSMECVQQCPVFASDDILDDMQAYCIDSCSNTDMSYTELVYNYSAQNALINITVKVCTTCDSFAYYTPTELNGKQWRRCTYCYDDNEYRHSDGVCNTTDCRVEETNKYTVVSVDDTLSEAKTVRTCQRACDQDSLAQRDTLECVSSCGTYNQDNESYTGLWYEIDGVKYCAKTRNDCPSNMRYVSVLDVDVLSIMKDFRPYKYFKCVEHCNQQYYILNSNMTCIMECNPTIYLQRIVQDVDGANRTENTCIDSCPTQYMFFESIDKIRCYESCPSDYYRMSFPYNGKNVIECFTGSTCSQRSVQADNRCALNELNGVQCDHQVPLGKVIADPTTMTCGDKCSGEYYNASVFTGAVTCLQGCDQYTGINESYSTTMKMCVAQCWQGDFKYRLFPYEKQCVIDCAEESGGRAQYNREVRVQGSSALTYECYTGDCYWYNNTAIQAPGKESGIKYCMIDLNTCNSTFPYLDSVTHECRTNCLDGKYLYDNTCQTFCPSSHKYVTRVDYKQDDQDAVYYRCDDSCRDQTAKFSEDYVCVAECRSMTYKYAQEALQKYICVATCPKYFVYDDNNMKMCMDKCSPDTRLNESTLQCQDTCLYYYYDAALDHFVCSSDCNAYKYYEFDHSGARHCLNDCAGSRYNNHYLSGNECVGKCPDFAQDGVCVRSCDVAQKYYPDDNGVCSNTCVYYRTGTTNKCTVGDVCPSDKPYKVLDQDGRFACQSVCNLYVNEELVCLQDGDCPYYYINATNNMKMCLRYCDSGSRFTEVAGDKEDSSVLGLRCEESCDLFLNKKLSDVSAEGVNICVAQCSEARPLVSQDGTRCVHRCNPKTEYISSDGTRCVAACDSYSVVGGGQRQCNQACQDTEYTVTGPERGSYCAAACPAGHHYVAQGAAKYCFPAGCTELSGWSDVDRTAWPYGDYKYTDGQQCVRQCDYFSQEDGGPVCHAACPGGAYETLAGGGRRCVAACPAYHVADAAGARECVGRCPAGHSLHLDECFAGGDCGRFGDEHRYLEAGVCVARCRGGAYATAGACAAACGPGEYYYAPAAGPGGDVCAAACPAGLLRAARDGRRCVGACEAGFYAEGGACVARCASGRLRAPGACLGAAEPCGHYAAAPERQRACRDGCAGAADGRAYGLAAADGTECVSAAECAAAGRFVDRAAAACAPDCPAGAFRRDVDGNAVCADGCGGRNRTRALAHGRVYDRCLDPGEPCGRYLAPAAGGAGLCADRCPAGTFLDRGAGRCVAACPGGHFYRDAALLEDVCLAGCAPPHAVPVADGGQTRCVGPCGPDRYDAAGACVDACPAGTYQAGGECLAECGSRYVALEGGRARCVAACDSGHYAYDPAIRRYVCRPGPCEAARTQQLDGVLCAAACAAGLYAEDTGECVEVCASRVFRGGSCVAGCDALWQQSGPQWECLERCADSRTGNVYRHGDYCLRSCPLATDGQECVDSCPSGKRLDEDSGLCVTDCHYLVRLDGSLVCTTTKASCVDGGMRYYEEVRGSKKCVRECGNFVSQDNVCADSCDEQLYNYDGQNKFCLARCNGYRLVDASLHPSYDRCYAVCPHGYYALNVSGQPPTCVHSCADFGRYDDSGVCVARCQNYYSHDFTACLSVCNDSQRSYLDPQGRKVCLDTCPRYALMTVSGDTATFECQDSCQAGNQLYGIVCSSVSCAQLHQQCVSGDCSLRDVGTISVTNSDGINVCKGWCLGFIENGICKDGCDSGAFYYNEKLDLYECQSACSSIWQWNGTSKQCIDHCPARGNDYIIGNRYWHKDTGECNNINCEKYVDSDGSSCVDSCTTPFVESNHCTQKCHAGYYHQRGNLMVCTERCDESAPFTDTNVFQEVNGKKMYQCLEDCPVGTIADGENKCVPGSCTTQYYKLIGRTTVCLQDCDLYVIEGSRYRCVDSCELAEIDTDNRFKLRCVEQCSAMLRFRVRQQGTKYDYLCSSVCPNKYYDINYICRNDCPAYHGINDSVYNVLTNQRYQCMDQGQCMSLGYNYNWNWECTRHCDAELDMMEYDGMTVCYNRQPDAHYIIEGGEKIYVDECSERVLVGNNVYNRSYVISNTMQCVQSCDQPHFIDEASKTCFTACPYYAPYYDATTRICATACSQVVEEDYSCAAMCASKLVEQRGAEMFCTSSCNGKPTVPYDNGQQLCVQRCPNNMPFISISGECTDQCPQQILTIADGQMYCIQWCDAFSEEYKPVAGYTNCLADCGYSQLGNTILSVEDNGCVQQCTGYLLEEQNKCYADCFVGGYITDEHTRKCTSDCYYYTDTQGKRKCIAGKSCDTSAQYSLQEHPASKHCVESCGDVYKFVEDGVCVASCSKYDSYIVVDDRMVCQQCGTNKYRGYDMQISSSVYRCADDCEYADGYYKQIYEQSRKCTHKCLNGFLLYVEAKECRKCVPSQNESCLHYVDGENHVYVTSCPSSHPIRQEETNMCVQRCDGVTLYDHGVYSCLSSCPDTHPFVTPEGFCVTACHSPYAFIDVDGSRCLEQCPTSAYTTTDGRSICVGSCGQWYVLSEHTLLNGTVAVQTHCIADCHDAPGHGFWYGRQCVTECPDQTFVNGITGECTDDCKIGSLREDRLHRQCSSSCLYYIEPHTGTRVCANVRDCGQLDEYTIQYGDQCVKRCADLQVPQYWDGSRCVEQCSPLTGGKTYFRITPEGEYVCLDEECGGLYGIVGASLYFCADSCPNGTVLGASFSGYHHQGRCVDYPCGLASANSQHPFLRGEECLDACAEGEFVQDTERLVCVESCGRDQFAVEPGLGNARVCASTCERFVYEIVGGATMKHCYVDACPEGTFQFADGECRAEQCAAFVLDGFKCVDSCEGFVAADGKNCAAECPERAFRRVGAQRYCTALADCILHYSGIDVSGTMYTECVQRCDIIDAQDPTLCHTECLAHTTRADGTKICHHHCGAAPDRFLFNVMGECRPECPINARFAAYDGAQFVCHQKCPTSHFYILNQSQAYCMNYCPRYYEGADAQNMHQCVDRCAGMRFGEECVAVCPQAAKYNIHGQCVPQCSGAYRYLQNGDQCVLQCNSLLYRIDGNDAVCVSGDSCDMYYIRQEHTGMSLCVAQCGDGYVLRDINSKECIAIAECAGYIHQNTYCVDQCDAQYYIYQNECLDQCPAGYYHTVNVKSQHECVMSCGGEYPYYNGRQCARECDSGIISEEYACVAQCPDDQYVQELQNGYKQCVRSCRSLYNGRDCVNRCPQGMGVNDQRCIDCKQQSLYLHNDRCVRNCPAGTYIVEQNGTCSSTCSSMLIQNGRCVHQCDQGYGVLLAKYCVNNCTVVNGQCAAADCNSSQKILRSESGLEVCVDSCPAPYYMSYNNLQYCLTQCSGRVYTIKNGSQICYLQCPSDRPFVDERDGNRCVDSVPQGMYYYAARESGEKVITECDGRLKNNATRACTETECEPGYYQEGAYCVELCSAGLYKSEGYCVEKCPPHQFADNETGECGPACRSGAFQATPDRGNVCVRSCPSYFAATGLGMRKCVDSCERFVGGANECLATCGHFVQVGSMRLCRGDACPGYYVAAANSWQCVQRCPQGYKVMGRECVRRCGDYSRYDQNGTCVEECGGVVVNDASEATCQLQCPAGQHIQDVLSRICISCQRYKYVLATEKGYVMKVCAMACDSPSYVEQDQCVHPSFACPNGKYLSYENDNVVCVDQCRDYVIHDMFCATNCQYYVQNDNKTCLGACGSQIYSYVGQTRYCRDGCDGTYWTDYDGYKYCSQCNITVNGTRECASNCQSLQMVNLDGRCIRQEECAAYIKNDDRDIVCTDSCSFIKPPNLCIEECPGQRYYDAQKNVYVCQPCGSEQIVLDQVCYDACPEESRPYYDAASGMCVSSCQFILNKTKCVEYCQYFELDSAQQKHCTEQCQGWYLYGDNQTRQCIDECGPGLYYDARQHKCLDQCEWYDASARECLPVCNGMHLVNSDNQTVCGYEKCPDGYVANGSSSECVLQMRQAQFVWYHGVAVGAAVLLVCIIIAIAVIIGRRKRQRKQHVSGGHEYSRRLGESRTQRSVQAVGGGVQVRQTNYVRPGAQQLLPNRRAARQGRVALNMRRSTARHAVERVQTSWASVPGSRRDASASSVEERRMPRHSLARRLE